LVFAQLAGAIATISLELVLSRVLGPRGRGAYGLFVAATQLGVVIGAFALGFVGVREYHQGRMARRMLIRASTSGSVPMALISASTVCTVLHFAYGTLFPVPFVLVTFLVIVPMAVVWNVRYAAIGLGSPGLSATSQLFERLGLLGAVSAGLWILGARFEVAVCAMGLQSLLVLALTLLLVKCRVRVSDSAPADIHVVSSYGALFPSASKLIVGNVAQFALYRFDLFLVAGMVSTSSAGIYALAVSLSSGLWYITDAAAQALYPIACGELSSSAVPTRTFRIATRVFLLTCVLGIASIPVVWFGLPIIVGDGFAPSGFLYAVLIPGVIALGITKLLSGVLMAKGQEARVSVVSGVGAAATVAVDLFLIPLYGAMGAAIASTVAYAISGLLTLFWVCRATGVGARDVLRLGEVR
jgi:O-antigen/teichoic acid export membrane protein